MMHEHEHNGTMGVAVVLITFILVFMVFFLVAVYQNVTRDVTIVVPTPDVPVIIVTPVDSPLD